MSGRVLTKNGSLNESVLEEFSSVVTQIVSDDQRRWIESILNVLMFTFATMGVITNAINIRVFIQQGLASDSNTIGLFALAIADFFGCILLIPTSLCDVFKHTANPDKLVSCISIAALAFNIPHAGMSRLTCWITVYIAVERSLCVLMPFKVKTLIQPRFTAISMLILYFALTVIYVPLYLNIGLEWRFSQTFNSSVVAFKENAMAREVMKFLGLIFNTILSTVAVIVIAITTGLMLYKLNKFQKWRQKASHGNVLRGQDEVPAAKQSDSVQGKRDLEVLKTVVMVTGLFLVCLSMSHFPGIAATFVPGFSIAGANKNIFFVLYYYKFVFDLINSSLNFFFYIKISSRYKKAFAEVFKKKRSQTSRQA